MKNFGTLLCGLSVVTFIFGSGCSTAPRRSGAETRKEVLEQARQKNTADARAYELIDSEYRKKNYDAVFKRSNVFMKAHPNSGFREHVHNLRALAYIAIKRYPSAISELKKVLELSSDESLQNMARYNLGYVHFELGQVDQAAQVLQDMHPGSLERGDRVKFHILHSKIARLRQDYPVSASDILSALANMPEPENSAATEPMLNFLDEVLEPITNIIVVEKLLGEFEASPAADRLLYKAGNYYLATGERDKAKDFFKAIATRFPQSRYYATAREYVRKFDHQGVVDPKRIGVVLTLSGKFGRFGYKALQGIELALKIFQPETTNGNVSLVVMDDQGDPDRAAAVVEELYFKHHVMAIIGPLVSKLADPVGTKAQELGVPLIALTQKEASGGDYVFNAALTSAMQVRELVRYAIEKAGAKHYAIVAPEGKFGEEYSNAFWDEIEQTGGVVRGFETYSDGETDFRTHVDKLVGLSQTDARGHEVEELRLLKAATPVKSRSKKFDRMFDLKPIVDFEVVFIPDEPKALGQILPTFAYRDVENILFLGINTWNSHELIARAGQFAEGSVFVDGFYAGSQSPSVQKFIGEYRATFGFDPGLVEALAYDAANILAGLLADGQVDSRSEMRDRITGLKNFPGVTGNISYKAGRLTKELTFLTVKNGKIEEVAFQ